MALNGCGSQRHVDTWRYLRLTIEVMLRWPSKPVIPSEYPRMTTKNVSGISVSHRDGP